MSRRQFHTGPVQLLLLLLTLLAARPAAAQVVGTEGTVTVAKGASILVTSPNAIQRISIGEPTVADAVAVSPREVLVTGKALGTTTLFVWDVNGNRRIYTIEVTADAQALERQFRALFPGQQIAVSSSGNLVILSGRVASAIVARRALEIAKGTGATVIDNLEIPAAQQVLLKVRFAELTQRGVLRLSSQLTAADPRIVLQQSSSSGNSSSIEGQLASGTAAAVQTLSDGLLRVLMFRPNFNLDASFNALRSTGDFRSLAEPNLIALDGSTASFLAGGEFPYPSVQSSGGGGSSTPAVTVQFREFGVRLNFTPNVTSAGNIRLHVAPEVSSLDFTTAVTIAGYTIPSLLSRKAETDVELKPGQTFAIAGLLNNTINKNVDRIPFLGDLPILGAFFRSVNNRQERSQLIVLVTPEIVQPTDTAPPVPTGEPGTWPWSSDLKKMPKPAVVGTPVPAPAPVRR